MRRFVVEKEFEHRGLKCVILFGYMGFRNGYVGVPKEHQHYGKDYHELEEIEVHGGLTYSGNNGSYPIESDLYWFGFDCVHLYDGQDLSKARELFPEYAPYYEMGLYDLGQHGVEACSLEYVELNCVELAEQLQKEKP